MPSDDATTLAPARAVPWFHLAIRFVLEAALSAGIALWGWHSVDGGPLGAILALLGFTLFWTAWGAFGTPGDPSRGASPVAIPGWARLLLECGLIGISSYAIWTSWSRAAAETLLTACVIHYALTWERSRWLWSAPAHPKRE